MSTNVSMYSSLNSLQHDTPDMSEILIDLLTPVSSRQSVNFILTLILAITLTLNIIIIALIFAIFGKLAKISKKAFLCGKELTEKFLKLLFSMDKIGHKFGSLLFHILGAATELAFRQNQQTATLYQLFDIIRVLAHEARHDNKIKGKPHHQDHHHPPPVLQLPLPPPPQPFIPPPLPQLPPPSHDYHSGPPAKEFKFKFPFLPFVSSGQVNLYPFTNPVESNLTEGYIQPNHRLGVIYAD